MDPDSTSQLIAIGAFLIMSAFFSAAETALLSVNRLKMKTLAEQKHRGAETVVKIIEKPDKLLSTVLIGNNAANVAISSLSTALALALFKTGAALSIAAIVATVAILIFSEITPKTVAANHPEKFSLFVARPIKILIYIFTPIAVILNVVTSVFVRAFGRNAGPSVSYTETEIKALVDVSHKEGIIETEERTMINNVFDFGDNTAKDIMTPRTDIVAISVEASYDQVMEIFKNERFSRILVFEDDIDNIIGILFFKDFIFGSFNREDFDIRTIIRPPFFSYENKPISSLFSEMRTEGIPIAVILDEYSGTSGIVTIEDLVEEIVGDISDEDDEDEEDIELITDDVYLVDGSMKIDDFNEMTGFNLKTPDYETMGGYVLGIAGRIPFLKEEFSENNITFAVEDMDKNRIDKLRVTINRKTSSSEE